MSILLICSPLFICFYMIFRNEWVYKVQMQFIDEEHKYNDAIRESVFNDKDLYEKYINGEIQLRHFSDECHKRYKRESYQSYGYMMKHFWIWDKEKFRK
jgi:hypothetical protein